MSWKRIFYVLFIVLVAGISALSGALAGGIAVYSVMKQAGNSNQQMAASMPTAVPQTVQAGTINIETDITKVVDQVGPAVVTITSVIPGQVTFFGVTSDMTSSGSGVIISSDGYILTNNHVVEGGNDIEVILANGTRLPAKVVGTDKYADVAVVQAQGDMPAVAALGDSSALKPGETVIAIGSPLGNFKNTVTVGVVSATGRSLDTGNGYYLEDMIQTDAAINQGNSGGPLLNLAGQVIGINTLIVRDSQSSQTTVEGLGFAIPANNAQTIANTIIEKGSVARPNLGIRWQSITPDIAQMYSLPVQWGVLVSGVQRNSPAANAGLQRGDIITQIGDVKIDGEHPYYNALFNYQSGQTIKIIINRDGTDMILEVTLG